ncbi:dihydrolipoyl dehydrogenase [Candidatus Sumerlaeota bacterium]|nr:dihydrolipoyl dehydrogenase [Candidatus Sumerlaeota bacterium]
MTHTCQIIIIGAGPGGYVAAIRCAQRGANVVLVDKDAVGGVCLNRGCVPTKALLATAKHYQFVQSAGKWGVNIDHVSFDWGAIIKRKDRVVQQLRRGVEYLLKKNKITLIHGSARLIAPHKIQVDDPDSTIIEAEKIILATGSEPVQIPLFPIDGVHIISSDEALALEKLPNSLVIVGGGVIGCEFATLFSTFGVKVTLVEALPDILALTSLDPFIIRNLGSSLKRQGISIQTGAPVQEIKVDKAAGTVETTLKSGEILTSEKALISIGRRSYTGNLGLEDLKIALNDKKDVIVDENMQTSIPGVYAIGDVTGKWRLAHTASFQGKIAAAHATRGEQLEIREDVVPSCIFTEPPVATIGLSETAAQQKGFETISGEFPYRALGKALTTDETEGWVKVVAEKSSGRILGAHILGNGAPEIIHEFALALQYKMKASDIERTIHAHPTYSESIPEACEAIFGISIHK